MIDRDGAPAVNHMLDLTGVSGLAEGEWFTPYDKDGTVELRVPEGTYIFNAGIVVDPEDHGEGADWLARPTLTVDRDISLTLDARTTEPVDITVPDATAEPAFPAPDFTLRVGENRYTFGRPAGGAVPGVREGGGLPGVRCRVFVRVAARRGCLPGCS